MNIQTCVLKVIKPITTHFPLKCIRILLQVPNIYEVIIYILSEKQL